MRASVDVKEAGNGWGSRSELAGFAGFAVVGWAGPRFAASALHKRDRVCRRREGVVLVMDEGDEWICRRPGRVGLSQV